MFSFYMRMMSRRTKKKWIFGSFTFFLLDILFEDDDKDDKEVVGKEVSLISWGGEGGLGEVEVDSIKGTAWIICIYTHVCAAHKTWM